jgi:hypothetical protein
MHAGQFQHGKGPIRRDLRSVRAGRWGDGGGEGQEVFVYALFGISHAKPGPFRVIGSRI